MACGGYTDPEGNCIPLLIVDYPIRWPDPPPNGDQFRHVFEDIATLVTINQRAAQIRDEGVRGQINQVIQQAAQTIAQQLPQGYELGDALFDVGTTMSAS